MLAIEASATDWVKLMPVWGQIIYGVMTSPTFWAAVSPVMIGLGAWIVKGINVYLKAILAEVKPNGGSSMNDKVNSTDQKIDGLIAQFSSYTDRMAEWGSNHDAKLERIESRLEPLEAFERRHGEKPVEHDNRRREAVGYT